MKKKDLKKMALMGITGGVMLAAQSAVAGGYSSSNSQGYYQNSCGGQGSSQGYYQNSCSSYNRGGYETSYEGSSSNSGYYAPQGSYQNGSTAQRGYYYAPQGEMDEGSISEDNTPPEHACSGKQSCSGVKNPQQPTQPTQPTTAPQPAPVKPNGQTSYKDNANKRGGLDR